MKKIPCLFVRDFRGSTFVDPTSSITPGCEWVMNGEGIATRKWDGTACAVINGRLHRRYDAKRGRVPPPGAIPCGDPDPVTGHWPHWIEVRDFNLSDQYHLLAWNDLPPASVKGRSRLEDGTYELIGPAIGGNPEGFGHHFLMPHGVDVLNVERTYDGIRSYLAEHLIEGIVFHYNNGRMCKIRRKDFGLKWPVRSDKVVFE